MAIAAKAIVTIDETTSSDSRASGVPLTQAGSSP
jgi:hypothetical protein